MGFYPPNEGSSALPSSYDSYTRDRLTRVEEAVKFGNEQRRDVMAVIEKISDDLAELRNAFSQHVVDDAKVASDIASINETLRRLEPDFKAVRAVRRERDARVQAAKWIIGLASGFTAIYLAAEHIITALRYIKGL